jgi:3-oxoacyl-[acyl-carrier-protein] synthase III
MALYLHGVGHFHPDHVIDNAFLESLDIGTSDAWIMERVGIRSRRTVMSLEYLRTTKNADPRAAAEASSYDHGTLGARAAAMALARARLTPADIGMVIAGSTAPDFVTPAEACNVAAGLGIEAPAFDLMSACTSFFLPMHLLSLMDPARLPPFVLIVVPETVTQTVDYRDRNAAVLWGDAAAAAVVSTRERGYAEIVDTTLASSPSARDKVVVPRQGFFRQDGASVQKFAIKAMTAMLHDLQARFAAPGRPRGFIGHQANLRMLENVCRRCDIPEYRHFHNVSDFGNTGAAGAPSVLSMRWESWSPELDLAMTGVGAGLTWSSLLLRRC